jgi:outer membrane protein OmpA-like peptidoglycan-associated protein/tetratricopeptide (TPR) repeat protein
MKIKELIYSTLLFVVSLNSFAQSAKIADANKKYDQYAYFDAIAAYEKIANKGYKDESMFQKLGNSYYFNAELPKSVKWYEELFAMNGNQAPEYFYRYSQALKSIGEYAKADKMLEQFNIKSGNEKRAKLFENHKNYLEEIKLNSGRYIVSDAGVNSKYSDFGSSFSGSNLVFASARTKTPSMSKKVFDWNNQAFTNLYGYQVKTKEDTAVSKKTKLITPKIFGNKMNSKFHESSAVFTKDGKTMYFTRNNYLNKKIGFDRKDIILLKIYKATFEDNKWTNEIQLPFNSDQYSVSHPALSADEKTLYFASDMPQSLGQSDLYKVAINEDGTYSTPENLGPSINTEGRETFPYITNTNELYFASDGYQGLGGLDIYVSSLLKDNTFSEVQNVGAPVNGPQDDFALLIEGSNGYFSSNREGGLGSDDIYKFVETKKLAPKIKCKQSLEGVVTDSETGLVLPNCKVSLFDENFKLVKEMQSNEKAEYAFEVECGKVYNVRSDKNEYETNESSAVTIPSVSGKTVLPLKLAKRIKKIGVGTDLAKSLNIPMIYFDLDKYFIRTDAAFELEKILAVLKQYPSMRIAIGSHTDSRQSFQYNATLSSNRAKSTKEWLIKNGVEASRLSSKGYGETQLVNNCSDGVECTEEEHQANRRSEFIVISM